MARYLAETSGDPRGTRNCSLLALWLMRPVRSISFPITFRCWGYLDDLILIPIGIALAIKMIPIAVLDECRARPYETMTNGMLVSLTAGAVIVVIWTVLAALCLLWVYQEFVASPASPSRYASRPAPECLLCRAR